VSRRLADQAQNAISSTELETKTRTIKQLEMNLDQARSTINHLHETLETHEGQSQIARGRIRALEAEREGILVDLEEFEEDLARQKESAIAFSKELERLRNEQSRKGSEIARVEGELRNARDRIRSLQSEVEIAEQRAESLERWKDVHECGL
jgi:chromosome segregation ATPase